MDLETGKQGRKGAGPVEDSEVWAEWWSCRYRKEWRRDTFIYPFKGKFPKYLLMTLTLRP